MRRTVKHLIFIDPSAVVDEKVLADLVCEILNISHIELSKLKKKSTERCYPLQPEGCVEGLYILDESILKE